MLDLSRAKITAGLGCWRLSKQPMSHFSVSRMCVVLMVFFLGLSVIRSCLLICLFLFRGFFISFLLSNFLKNLECKREPELKTLNWKGGQQREIERDLPFYFLSLSSFPVQTFSLSSFIIFHFELLIARLIWVYVGSLVLSSVSFASWWRHLWRWFSVSY